MIDCRLELTENPAVLAEMPVVSMYCREGLSSRSEMCVTLRVPQGAIGDMQRLADVTAACQRRTLGVTVSSHDEVRNFSGFIFDVAYDWTTGYLECNVRPSLRLLEHERLTRHFGTEPLESVIRSICEPVLKIDPHFDIEWIRTTPGDRPHVCSQENETTCAFLSRILEDEGLTYQQRMSGDDHRLVITDSLAQHVQDIDLRRFSKLRTSHRTSCDVFLQRGHDDKQRRFVVGSFPEQGQPIVRHSEYDPRWTENEVSSIAKRRWEELRTDRIQTWGCSDVVSLCPGDNVAIGSLGAVRICEVTHEVHCEHEQQRVWSYQNTLVMIPGTTTFRPPRRTPVPQLRNRIAYVVDPSGETLNSKQATFADELGRVFVSFASDGGHPSQSTLGSTPGGKGVRVPRIGEAVILDYVGGYVTLPHIAHSYETELVRLPYAPGRHALRETWGGQSPGQEDGNWTQISIDASSEVSQVYIGTAGSFDTKVNVVREGAMSRETTVDAEWVLDVKEVSLKSSGLEWCTPDHAAGIVYRDGVLTIWAREIQLNPTSRPNNRERAAEGPIDGAAG